MSSTADRSVAARGRDWADGLPPVREVGAAEVRSALDGAPRLVVLDDDPTGTQTVRDVPVLTRWTPDDVAWALAQDAPGFFILTNTRSLSAPDAAARTREVVTACLEAAAEGGETLVFASRSDSTLRGHFPLETDVIAEVLAEHGSAVDALVLAPAYLDAGRMTLDGIQWIRSGSGLTPVAESEFARDASFGYRSSRLRDWVVEKSLGAVGGDRVREVALGAVREAGSTALTEMLRHPTPGEVLVLDAVVDDDLRGAVVAAVGGEGGDAHLLYRVGPSFVRARLGQDAAGPIDDDRLRAPAGRPGPRANGLVVVGSHVGLTGRQLARLQARREHVAVELDVASVLDPQRAGAHLDEVVEAAAEGLDRGLVVLSTSRALVTGLDAEASLAISRTVGAALTRAVAAIVERSRPGWVVAKGGITSSDLATDALRIDRAWVRGSMLPGIVSLWEAASGPAAGLPYVVFAGNVGDDEALADVVDRWENA